MSDVISILIFVYLLAIFACHSWEHVNNKYHTTSLQNIIFHKRSQTSKDMTCQYINKYKINNTFLHNKDNYIRQVYKLLKNVFNINIQHNIQHTT